MSLSLEFSSNVLSRFLEAIASNQVIFHQSSSVQIEPAGTVAVVHVTELLYEDFRGGEFHYKGRTLLPNEPSPREVIVKILFGHKPTIYAQKLQRYIHEAKIYQDRLCNKSLEIPRIYGFYETKLTWKVAKLEKPVDAACIVYQYYGSGENLQWSTGAGISDFSLKAFKLLLDIHKSGVRHNLIGLDRNITCLDGRPFVKDFSEAHEHDCPEKEFELPTRLFDLDADTLKCGELRDFYRSLRRRVAPLRFHWYGYDVDYDQVDSLESIFQHKRRTFGMDTPVEEQWNHAVKMWEFICANWSSYHKEGEAPLLGNTSFEAYKAKHGLDIIYDDE
ncbi:hypothetical protein H2248_003133 [Termitomyces sp. 'cryptogamus']|nr:hypothetical protein H2248_003133 [Termitomyces sp. 'cryptogamus']